MKVMTTRGRIAAAALALLAGAVGVVMFGSIASAAAGGPTVTLSTTASSTTNLATIPVTATFSGNVNSFTASDVTVTNGTVSNVATSTPSTVFTFNVTPTADDFERLGGDHEHDGDHRLEHQ